MEGEIIKLRQLLHESETRRLEEQRRREEEQRRREEEQRRREEEQRQREEEQRRREEEQRRREEEQRRREEEQRRREEEQRRREEEQRRREEAEALAKSSQPQALQDYLHGCHSLSLAIQVVTDPSCTTKGDTTKPAGRLFPRRIIPWNDFATEQEKTWDQLLISNDFHSRRAFPSQHQLAYVQSMIAPISAEHGLRHYERETVENAVQTLVNTVYDDNLLRNQLGLRGTVTFESHTNLGETNDSSITESMAQTRMNEDNQNNAERATKRRRKGKETAQNLQPVLPQTPKKRRKARGKGNRADQFCICRTSDGQDFPTVAIEYKAPHKLRVDQIVKGLESEIQPERDVINKVDDDFGFAPKSLAAAVITQLFSYMIGKGVQYGYVCTGEAFVFLHIPDDPTEVHYSISVPNLDFQEDDENRFHRTAVAQVFAFVLRALRAKLPDQSWLDKTSTLDTWDVEYVDILRNIPETVRKQRYHSPYKPQRWQGFQRSPIRTRSRCKPFEADVLQNDDEDDSPPPSPTQGRTTRSRTILAETTGNAKINSKGKQEQGTQGTQGTQPTQKTRQKIEDRPYCTQKCLRGLVHGGPMDNECPNAHDHGRNHIRREVFVRLIRDQLARDRGPDADCVPLYLSGSRGALFKVRLSSHGYTLVAKGVEDCDRSLLLLESKCYDRLDSIQGYHVPVCIGVADLLLPYYYDCGVYVRFLLLSWAGQPLWRCINRDNKERLQNKAAIAFKALHRLHVLHRDAEIRNMVYDRQTDNLMIVDFERSEIRDRPALKSVDLNRPIRKRKYKCSQVEGKTDDFEAELRSVISRVSRSVM